MFRVRHRERIQHDGQPPQAFHQMAGWLWRTSCPPENVYWVLINSVENPSFLRGQVRVPPPDAVVAGLPRRTNLTVPEYVSKCAARAVAILEKDAGDGQTAR